MMGKQLKPCQCGSDRVGIISGKFSNATDQFKEGQKFWRVWCKDCQMRTGPEKTQRDAVMCWNTRRINIADVPANIRMQIEAEALIRFAKNHRIKTWEPDIPQDYKRGHACVITMAEEEASKLFKVAE